MILRRRLYILLALTLLSPIALLRAQEGDFSVNVQLDSAYLLMGKTTPLHVEVLGPLSETGGLILPDTLWRDVEVARVGEPTIIDHGNGRKELRQEIILQAFDSGFYTLPPVLYVQDNKVVESNRAVLKVIPVDVDSMRTVHDYAAVQTPPFHLLDFVPDWITDWGIWVLLGLLVIAAGLYIYLAYLRKGKIPLVPQAKPIPPYELAMSRLNTLREEHLCERGEEKEYYTRLTDILRSYLDSRFGINAMEMTSGQILRSLHDNPDTRLPHKYMKRVLEVADFVKFARLRPLPDDNVQAFKAAQQFVEDTKPVPEPTEAPDSATGSTNTAPESPTNTPT